MKYRQAHRLPPRKWEQALFVMALLITLTLVALEVPSWTP